MNRRFLVFMLLSVIATTGAGTPASVVSASENVLRTVGKAQITLATHIRLLNTSGQPFTHIRVTFPHQVEEFGPLAPGQATAYRAVTLAYRYALIEVLVDGTAYTLQPIDYVGEMPLPAGTFTYALSVDVARGLVTLRCVRDSIYI